MSRATYVWVVQAGIKIPAAFTVRHELVSWLRRQDIGNPSMTIWHVPDNPPDPRYVVRLTTVYSAHQILEMYG